MQEDTGSSKNLKQSFNVFSRELKTFAGKLIDLKDGMDRQKTEKYIMDNKRMQGANAWLLMCSIVIASLGLDMNSPAVIIGAMLISPLMAPILGIGFSFATNNRSVLSVSLQHYSIAVAIALVTSTVYFYFTPFGNITDEIISRTEPTFLDVLVAFFGGLAGIISITRKDVSTAIPGVAIATALMPPLCVTGFGVAKWLEMQFGNYYDSNYNPLDFILNSFYLFFLNSFFVGIATFLIVRLLRFPFRAYENRRTRIRNRSIMVAASIVLIIPSFLILTKVLRKVNLERNAQAFVETFFDDRKELIDDTKLLLSDEGYSLVMRVYGYDWDNLDTIAVSNALLEHGLNNTKLQIIKASEIDVARFENLQSELYRVSQNLDERLNRATQIEIQQREEIQLLEEHLDSIEKFDQTIVEVCKEIETLTEPVQHIYCAPKLLNEPDSTVMLFVQWKERVPLSVKDQTKKRLSTYFADKTGMKTILFVDQ